MKMYLLAGVAAAVMTAIGFTGSAGAADMRMPTKARPAPPPPPAWSGCYLGFHLGYGSGHTSWQDTLLANGAIDPTFTGRVANTDHSGGLYGGQVGCDMAFGGGFVFGIAASYSAANIVGTDVDPFDTTWSLRAKTDSIADVVGRFGFVVQNALLYGRGGVAWAHNKLEIANTGIFVGSPSVTRQGYVVGGGIEWAFAPNWSVFLEGNYYNFSGATVHFLGDVVNPTPAFDVRTRQEIETVKFGVNYRFGNLGLGF